MASHELKLTSSPVDEDQRELWLQHAAGAILFEDVRGYALDRMSSELSPEAKAAVRKGVNDALYGLMMLLDGVAGTLANESEQVELRVQIVRSSVESGDVLESLDTQDGDGMCMGYHGWLEGDFGEHPPHVRRA